MADKLLLDIPGDNLQVLWIETKLWKVVAENPVGDKVRGGWPEDDRLENKIL